MRDCACLGEKRPAGTRSGTVESDLLWLATGSHPSPRTGHGGVPNPPASACPGTVTRRAPPGSPGRPPRLRVPRREGGAGTTGRRRRSAPRGGSQGERVQLDRPAEVAVAAVRRLLLRPGRQPQLVHLCLGDCEALDRLHLDAELGGVATRRRSFRARNSHRGAAGGRESGQELRRPRPLPWGSSRTPSKPR